MIGILPQNTRYEQDRTLRPLRAGEAGGLIIQHLPKSKAIKCQEKAINGEWEEVWKSVEKTPILQPINYQVIIQSVEMVEKKISTA